MQAIEFTGVLQNGVVRVPAQYQSLWEGKTIRVIVVEDTGDTSVQNLQQSEFRAIALNTQGFQFNRDEVNTR